MAKQGVFFYPVFNDACRSDHFSVKTIRHKTHVHVIINIILKCTKHILLCDLTNVKNKYTVWWMCTSWENQKKNTFSFRKSYNDLTGIVYPNKFLDTEQRQKRLLSAATPAQASIYFLLMTLISTLSSF